MKKKLLRTLLKLIGRPSPYCAFMLSTWAERITRGFRMRSKQVISKNLALCYPLHSDADRKRMARQAWIHMLTSPFEMARAWVYSPEENFQFLQQCSGFDAIQTQATQGKSMILICPHLGNWEFVNLFLAAHLKISILYRSPKQRWLEEPIRQARERSGTEMAPANAEGVRQLFRTLKAGGIVGFLPDQDPGTQGGHLAPFFGIPTNTMTLVSKLAAKSQTSVHCITAYRTEDHRGYRVECFELPERIRSSDLTESTTCLNQAIEHAISKAPEQYQWSYKRFKRSHLKKVYES